MKYSDRPYEKTMRKLPEIEPTRREFIYVKRTHISIIKSLYVSIIYLWKFIPKYANII